MSKIFNLTKIKLLALMILGYGSFYFLNNYLTKGLYLAPAAHIVHLPSGVKMLMVLVSGVLASLAITIVGFVYGIAVNFHQNYMLAMVLATASGAAPLIALFVLEKTVKLANNLSNLNWDKLMLIAITYAVVNSFLHQLIIYSYDKNFNLLNGLLVMFTGDVTGIFITLYLFRFALKIYAAQKETT